jgi:3-dehydroquinate dehydratase II
VKIAVIHGANLRLLGTREPEVYGTDTLEDVNAKLAALAAELGVTLETVPVEPRGEILDFIERPRSAWTAS